ncbi:uncharacterized protein EAE98_008816 [Botrytis deweyae]|uniref:Uncharacterized protein n=1 Tax=Botrytis deweyae TaxID=2478750 RepID=A0ABQ7ID48_9HELO|nr:uncharacterized protein EAE98_008816 [Botrytis deweyae]KAF7920787.1 hypothetical protein EAE98_008816 [Botrytis deweyae]
MPSGIFVVCSLLIEASGGESLDEIDEDGIAHFRLEFANLITRSAHAIVLAGKVQAKASNPKPKETLHTSTRTIRQEEVEKAMPKPSP